MKRDKESEREKVKTFKQRPSCSQTTQRGARVKCALSQFPISRSRARVHHERFVTSDACSQPHPRRRVCVDDDSVNRCERERPFDEEARVEY